MKRVFDIDFLPCLIDNTIQTHLIVMVGLVPAIHVFVRHGAKDVDARDRRGHDET
jgi:hypothetical protein